MRRNVPSRSLMNATKEPPEINYSANYCPLPAKSSLKPNDTEKLIIRYRNLLSELKKIRGKLYSMGIDPEKYTHL